MKPHTVADKLLMAEISQKLGKHAAEEKWDARRAAQELGVCLASWYKYIAKTDLPRIGVIQHACEHWGLSFQYGSLILDKKFFQGQAAKRKTEPKVQLVLPFIESLRQEDIRILQIIPKKPNGVELRLEITFSGERKQKLK